MSELRIIYDEADIDILEQTFSDIIFAEDTSNALASLMVRTVVFQENNPNDTIVTEFESELYFASYFAVYFNILAQFLCIDDAHIEVTFEATYNE